MGQRELAAEPGGQSMSDLIVPWSREHCPSTSMSLLERASEGDHEAWERIVHLYSPLVDRWCQKRHLKQDAIPGIGQDVFLTLFKNLGKFRKDDPKHGFRKWLWIVTTNKIFDYLRQVRDEPPGVGGSDARAALENYPGKPVSSEGEGEDGSTPRAERLILLRRCLEAVQSEFEPRTYQAFWEVVMEAKPPGEVARSMGMKSVGAVYTAKSRVVQRLRALLEGLGHDMSSV
jgi:RNA polymerase sigma-70 factor, ECF subfamily